MKIKFVNELTSGYASLYSLLLQKGFVKPCGTSAEIPLDYAVITDGKFWNLIKP
jgi:hypothetical protein